VNLPLQGGSLDQQLSGLALPAHGPPIYELDEQSRSVTVDYPGDVGSVDAGDESLDSLRTARGDHAPVLEDAPIGKAKPVAAVPILAKRQPRQRDHLDEL